MALFLGSCATERAVEPGPVLKTERVADATPAGGPSGLIASPAGAAEPVRPVQFESEVRPILEAKCSPCHFPGGKMYDRLPFDRPETIRFLGTNLFTRLTDEADQATVRAFLESPPPAAVP